MRAAWLKESQFPVIAKPLSKEAQLNGQATTTQVLFAPESTLDRPISLYSHWVKRALQRDQMTQHVDLTLQTSPAMRMATYLYSPSLLTAI